MKDSISIGLVLPDVLGTYGDDGNALVLRQRARLRGIGAEIIPLTLGKKVPDNCDVYTVGGGEDIAQIVAAERLIADGGLQTAAQAGKPVLAICAGLQIFGDSFHAAGRQVQGLGLLDIETTQLSRRMIGEIQSVPDTTRPRSDDTAWVYQLTEPLTGFANHMGATVLGPQAEPLGTVTRGTGNTDTQGLEISGVDTARNTWQINAEGVVQGSVIATYMHGPALARNPQLADVLLSKALGVDMSELPALNHEQLKKEVALLRAERLA